MANIKELMDSRSIKIASTLIGISKEEYILYRESGLKLCCKCKTWRNEKEFGKNRSTYDGLEAMCSECIRKKSKISNRSLKGKFKDYKHKSKKKNISFDLTFEEFQSFWQKSCIYCNSEIETIGIDRINSNIGYILENCVPCCSICNYMKLDYKKKEWFEQIIKILKFQKLL